MQANRIESEEPASILQSLSMPQHIVFDAVGLLVSHTHFWNIASQIPSLAQYNVKPELLGFA
jgi:hypothetical protein